MATTTIIPLHRGRGRTVASALAGTLDYIEDPDKTDGGELISSYECDAKTADSEFMLSKSRYENLTGRNQGDNNVIGYHVRQSFRPGEVTPEQANRIGYELAMRFTRGRHAFVVCTHIDRDHIHSHIIWNSTALDCRRKFRNFLGSSFALRRVSDRLCLENGLSIVEKPKQRGGRHYGTWLGENKKPSFQAQIKQAIDTALEKKPSDFEEFLKLLEELGVEVLRDKRLRFRVPGQKQPTLCRTLKGDYTEEAIRERIAGKRIVSPDGARASRQQDFGLIIDVQEKIRAGKGPGYTQWAKIFNLKQAAKTLIYLQEHGLDNYSALADKAVDASAQSNALSERVKELDHVLAANANLQKHIVGYSKTREVYASYRKAGYSKKFKAAHEADILLHQASKRAFDELGYGREKKLPTVKELREEYAERLAEKKEAYAQYRQSRTDMRELLNAKANVDVLLGIGKENRAGRRSVEPDR